MRKCAVHDQIISRDVVIILGVSDSAIERLGDEAGRFARDDRQQSDRFRGLAALDGAGHFAHFLRRHARISGEGLNFHDVSGDSPGGATAAVQK